LPRGSGEFAADHPMRFDILTIFPDFFSGPFDHGVLGRAIATGLAQVRTHDLREFTHDRHRTVDDRPFGGGEGMVLKPEPIFECVQSLGVTPKTERDQSRESVILLSAQGRPFTQELAHQLATLERAVLICGRYEGVDERVNDMLANQEVSIGDYVLSGGELAAAILIDATVRLLPGVLGNPDSARFESFGQTEGCMDLLPTKTVPRSTHAAGGLLDYPHYTRPADFRGAKAPEVLSSGDHLAIRRWRRQQALARTARNRPDLLAKATLTDEDREYVRLLGREDARQTRVDVN
jgi:tRNA (guanine37-N1)-methyltransferase